MDLTQDPPKTDVVIQPKRTRAQEKEDAYIDDLLARVKASSPKWSKEP